jgi:hypothetical protein
MRESLVRVRAGVEVVEAQQLDEARHGSFAMAFVGRPSTRMTCLQSM